MADQGQPLMTVPQTNLFGQAADDIRSILANREVAKQKALLDSLAMQKTQADIAKTQADTGKIGADTAETQARIPTIAPKAAADLAHTGAETASLGANAAKTNQEVADHAKLGKAMDDWTAALGGNDLNEQIRTGTVVATLGAKFMPPELIKELGAKSDREAAGVLMDEYDQAFKAKDTAGMIHAGLKLMGKGIKVPGMDASPYQPFGNGGIMNSMTGGQVQAPQPPAGAAALTGDQGVNTIAGYKDLLRHGAQISAIPVGARNAVVADMAKNGESFETLTMQGRAMTDLAKTLVPKISALKNTWQQIDNAGLTGTINGRLRNLAAGESLAATTAGLTPEQKNLIGKFEGEVSLFTSGTTRAHFQRAGAETYAIMEKLLNPGGKDFQTYLGNLDAANEYLSSYANMGGLHAPGETLLTPSAGAGKGGGAAAPPAGAPVTEYVLVNGKLVPKGGG